MKTGLEGLLEPPQVAQEETAEGLTHRLLPYPLGPGEGLFELNEPLIEERHRDRRLVLELGRPIDLLEAHLRVMQVPGQPVSPSFPERRLQPARPEELGSSEVLDRAFVVLGLHSCNASSDEMVHGGTEVGLLAVTLKIEEMTERGRSVLPPEFLHGAACEEQGLDPGIYRRRPST